MTRSYFAADTAQPVSVAVRDALTAGLSSAWADPIARSYEGRSTAVILQAAARAISVAAGAPEASVAVTPGPATALSVAVSGAGVADLTAVAGRADRQAVLAAIRARNSTRTTVGGPSPRQGDLLDVDRHGRFTPADLRTALAGGDVGVVCTQVGNPEIGSCPDLAGIAAVAHDAGAVVVLDATMSVGRCPMPDPSLWDIAVLWANSWAGGVDVAVVLVQPGVRWSPSAAVLPVGAPARPAAGVWSPWGSPSVPLVAAAAVGLEASSAKLPERQTRDRVALTRLQKAAASVEGVEVYGSDPRLPHILGLSALYVDAEALTAELDTRGLAVSSGSACATGGRHSHVLEAIGGLSSGNVRVTLPLEYTAADIDLAAEALPEAIRASRAAVRL